MQWKRCTDYLGFFFFFIQVIKSLVIKVPGNDGGTERNLRPVLYFCQIQINERGLGQRTFQCRVGGVTQCRLVSVEDRRLGAGEGRKATSHWTIGLGLLSFLQ